MSNEYAWSASDRERKRLADQGDALRPATERLFRAAGIGSGARVLDCGLGGGDVVLIANGIATEAQIDMDTFADRARVECGTDPVLIIGPDLAVWARKP